MSEFHVGFTGTKKGMTVAQAQQLEAYCSQYAEKMTADGFVSALILHHGDCVGADAQAHMIAGNSGWQVEIHPGTDNDGNSPYRANCEGSFVRAIHPPCRYAERNVDIVTTTAMLLATPSGPEKMRSGTWSTVRAARKMSRPVIVFTTEGDVYGIGMEDHEHAE